MLKDNIERCIHRHTREEHPNCFRDVSAQSSISDGSARVGIFDVETLPMVVYAFSLYNTVISPEKVISDTSLLSWAGKFLNSPEKYSDVLSPEEALLKADERIVRSCWKFLSKCDIVIGHNLSNFDKKVANTFFLKYGLPPIKYIEVDTLQVARNNFRFSSNKLDFINHYLGIDGKLQHEGFNLWARCHRGDSSALEKMKRYNIRDVSITEELFYRVRPYIRNINFSLYNQMEINQCPVCGSTSLVSEGFYYTSAGKWESVRCTQCGALSRKKQNLLTKDKKKSLLINS